MSKLSIDGYVKMTELFSTFTVPMQKSMKIVFDDGISAHLNHILTVYAVPLRPDLNRYKMTICYIKEMEDSENE